MAKNKKVGTLQSENKLISKPLIKVIIKLQRDLQDKEDKKKRGKKKNISFVYASLELSKLMKNDIKK